MKKSHDHTHLKRLAAISLVVVMCLSALPMLAPSAAAEPIVVSNDRTEDRVVFEQDYSELYHVPTNLVLLNDISPYRINNVTLSYNYTANAVNLFALGTDAIGALCVAGLYPAVETNITMDLEFSRINFNTGFEVRAGNAWVQVSLRDSIAGDQEIDYLRITSLYYDAAGILQNSVPLTDPVYPKYQNIARFNLSIHSSNVEQVNKIYVDGRLILTTPYYPRAPPSAFSPFSNPFVHIKITGQDVVNWGDLNIHSITQTVPAYQYVTPISDPSITPYGLDGPHPYGTVDEGIALLQQYEGRGTIWADVGDLASYSEENITKLKQLIADGWELGIHYSTWLSKKSMEQAIEIMRSEHATITEMFGQSPTSWCSHANNDNVTHANYAYANLGMAWRNGYNGVHSFANVGNLDDATWTWWANASAAGMVYPTFTHQTDPDPAVAYSISYSKFETWLDNYAAAGVRIVPYYDYWTLAQNTGHTEISDLMVDDGKSMSFTLDNIGGRSRLFVAAPWTEKVLDGNGNEVPFEAVDDGIIIEVEAGEYQIYSMSGYRQDQVDRAISPLYAAIPVVVMLAVIGGLITMVGRIKF